MDNSDKISVVTLQYLHHETKKIHTYQFETFEECKSRLKYILLRYEYEWVQVREHSIDIAENEYVNEKYLFYIELDINNGDSETRVLKQLFGS